MTAAIIVEGYLYSHKALAGVFRTKMLTAITAPLPACCCRSGTGAMGGGLQVGRHRRQSQLAILDEQARIMPVNEPGLSWPWDRQPCARL